MKLTNEEVGEFINLLEDVAMQEGGKVSDYSGRGMYGKRCVAFFPDSEYADVFALGVSVAARANDYDFPIRLIPGASTDSMGRGIVLYFPSAEWPEDRKPPEDDENEW